MDQHIMSQGRTVKSSGCPGGTETIVWNVYSYLVPAMVGTNASTNEKHKFYNSTVQAISRGGEDLYAKFGALCACFVDKVSPVKTQVGNGLIKLLYFRYQTINMYKQDVFALK